MEIPPPDLSLVRESLYVLLAAKAIKAGSAFVGYVRAPEKPLDFSLSIPSISSNLSPAGDEIASPATVAQRMDRVQQILASDEQGAEASIPPDTRDRALGHAANVGFGVQLLELPYRATVSDMRITFNDLNNAITAGTLRRASEAMLTDDLDAQLRLQNDILAGAQIVADTYALAAIELASH